MKDLVRHTSQPMQLGLYSLPLNLEVTVARTIFHEAVKIQF